jgi:hypothetical protein
MSILVNKAAHQYTPPKKRAFNYESAIGAYPAKRSKGPLPSWHGR